MAQRHLRRVLANLGASVMGGEAHVAYKPGLIDGADGVADAETRAFCNRLSIGLSIDRFAGLAGRLAGAKADVVAA